MLQGQNESKELWMRTRALMAGPRVLEEVLKKRSIRTFSLKEGMTGVMLTFALKLLELRADMRSTKMLCTSCKNAVRVD